MSDYQSSSHGLCLSSTTSDVESSVIFARLPGLLHPSICGSLDPRRPALPDSPAALHTPRWHAPLDPSPGFRTRDHLLETAACGFFVVPTATFRLLYCFVILSHDRRRIVHLNIASSPTAEWTTQQIIEALPGEGPVPRFLVHDRDSIQGDWFRRRVKGTGIREVITGRKSPWQNPFAERAIGSIRRECLDDLIVLGERLPRRILMAYVAYYNGVRPHRSLQRNAPIPRKVEPSAT